MTAPASGAAPSSPLPPLALCPCGKRPLDLCLCPSLTPLPLRTRVVIVQHPQEQDMELGTARLLTGQVEGAILRTGLSWPNLGKITGRSEDASRWGVLYMGSKNDVAKTPRGGMAAMGKEGIDPDSDAIVRSLQGIVLLDGTWAQAKTLWWRNPWLLKLRRIVIHPDFRSAYGDARKEPRRESISTLEAAAFALERLEGMPGLRETLTAPFAELLRRWRKHRPSHPRQGQGRPTPAPTVPALGTDGASEPPQGA
jgi:DTW domain-containing protein